jgi:hypothetical protein
VILEGDSLGVIIKEMREVVEMGVEGIEEERREDESREGEKERREIGSLW